MKLNEEQLNLIKNYLETQLKDESNNEYSLFFNTIWIKFFNLHKSLDFPDKVNKDCISIYFLLMSIIQANDSINVIKKYNGEDIFTSLMSSFNTLWDSRIKKNNESDNRNTETNINILEWDAKTLALILISLKIVYTLYFSGEVRQIDKELLNIPFSDSFKSKMITNGFKPLEVLEYLNSCYNLDYGYGSNPNRESHCGYIYAALCSYKLLIDFFDIPTIQSCINTERLIEFYKTLNANPGIKGRKNKQPDLCYNFWVKASIKIINAIHAKEYKLLEIFPDLKKYNKLCFKEDSFSSHPDSDSDVFHTIYFLLYTKLEFIDSIYLI